MSLWYLTASECAARTATALCSRIGLSRSGDPANPPLYGEVFLKRAISTPMFVRRGENDWVCAAGTVIHGGQLGTEALKRCYDDFADGGVLNVQRNAIGHYALAIKKGASITAFVDPLGSFTLFYSERPKDWFLSNALSLCVRSLPSRPELNATRLMINAVQSTLPGEDTPFEGVKRLFGTQAVVIGLSDLSLRVEAFPESHTETNWDFDRIEDALVAYRVEVQEVFQQLARVGQIGVMGTGGLDSRTVLAALMDQNASLRLMYALGNSKLTDYDPRDLGVVKSIAERFGISFSELDWSGSQPFSHEKLSELFGLYGFDYEIYGASDGFIRTYAGDMNPYPDLSVGGYSPAFTNSKPWTLANRLYTFDELVDESMRSQKGPIEQNRSVRFSKDYKAEYCRQVRVALKRAGIEFPSEGVPLETFVRAKLFLYIRPESRYLNFVNIFGNYVAPFLLKRLYDPLLAVPFRFRAEDEFQIRLIHMLAPGLTEIPLFSGWGPAAIDRQTFRMVRPVTTRRRSAASMAAGILPKPVKSWIRRLRSNGKKSGTPVNSRDAEICQTYGAAIMRTSVGAQCFNELEGFSPKEIARIHHYLSAIEFIQQTK